MSGLNLEQYMKELKTLVNIDSGSNDIEGIQKVSDWMSDKYSSIGMKAIIEHHGDSKRPFVKAWTPNTTYDGDIDLLFIGHMDTVFPRGTVSERPFSTDGEKAYGPGVADMKAGVLLTAYLLERLMKECPDIKIFAAHNGDEELGSNDSGKELMALGKRAKYCFDMEPGRITGNFVKNRKGVAEYKVNFHGKASHAGNAPEKGVSAVRELSRWIEDTVPMNSRETGISVNVGVISGGTASNVIPEFAECIIDVRYLSMDQLREVENTFDNMAAEPRIEGVKTTIAKISQFPPMFASPETEKLIEVIMEEGRLLGQTFDFENSGGGSDASLISSVGTPVIDGCGPSGDMLHSSGEYMVISSVEERFNLLENAVKRFFK